MMTSVLRRADNAIRHMELKKGDAFDDNIETAIPLKAKSESEVDDDDKKLCESASKRRILAIKIKKVMIELMSSPKFLILNFILMMLLTSSGPAPASSIKKNTCVITISPLKDFHFVSNLYDSTMKHRGSTSVKCFVWFVGDKVHDPPNPKLAKNSFHPRMLSEIRKSVAKRADFSVVTLEEMDAVKLPYKFDQENLHGAMLPFAFEYASKHFGATSSIYLDSHMWVTDSLKDVEDQLQNHSVVVASDHLMPSQHSTAEEEKEGESNTSKAFDVKFLGFSYSDSTRTFLESWCGKISSYRYDTDGVKNPAEFSPESLSLSISSSFKTDEYYVFQDRRYNVGSWHKGLMSLYMKDGDPYFKDYIANTTQRAIFVNFPPSGPFAQKDEVFDEYESNIRKQSGAPYHLVPYGYKDDRSSFEGYLDSVLGIPFKLPTEELGRRKAMSQLSLVITYCRESISWIPQYIGDSYHIQSITIYKTCGEPVQGLNELESITKPREIDLTKDKKCDYTSERSAHWIKEHYQSIVQDPNDNDFVLFLNSMIPMSDQLPFDEVFSAASTKRGFACVKKGPLWCKCDNYDMCVKSGFVEEGENRHFEGQKVELPHIHHNDATYEEGSNEKVFLDKYPTLKAWKDSMGILTRDGVKSNLVCESGAFLVRKNLLSVQPEGVWDQMQSALGQGSNKLECQYIDSLWPSLFSIESNDDDDVPESLLNEFMEPFLGGLQCPTKKE